MNKKLLTSFLLVQISFMTICSFALVYNSGTSSTGTILPNTVFSPSDWSEAEIISDDLTLWNNDTSETSAIAVDSDGFVHAVWVDRTPGLWGSDREIFYANYSVGNGWTNATVISDGYGGVYWNNHHSIDPAIAVGDDGSVHVVWMEWTDGIWGTDTEIFYANYAPGVGWSNATVISDNGNWWNIYASETPSICVDNTGVIHVVWADATYGTWGTDTEIMYTKYTSSWANATVISGVGLNSWNDGFSYKPKIAADSNGVLHVVWEDQTNTDGVGTDKDIMYMTHVSSWSNATVLSDNSSNWNDLSSTDPSIAVDSADTVHVVWADDTQDAGIWGTDKEIWYITKTAISSSWSTPRVISDTLTQWNDGDSDTPRIAIDGTDAVHVVWEDLTTGAWGSDGEIMYTYKKAGGIWTKAVPISDNDTDWNTGSSLNPAIAIDKTRAKMYVLWEDLTPGWWGTDKEILFIMDTLPIPSGPILQPISPNPSTDGIINLTWSLVPTTKNYYIYRDTSNITSVGGKIPIGETTNSNYTDTITINADYFYVVVAGYKFINSSISNCESITVAISAGGIPSFELNLLCFALISAVIVFQMKKKTVKL